MYNKALNYMFNFFSCLEKSKAIGLANKFVSNQGVQRNLEQRLRHNENFRYQISRGKIREEFAADKLDAARERIRANFSAGLIDSGKYYTQLYKINALQNMRFAEQYNRWVTDRDSLKYYKLKYAAQLGEDAERAAFKFYENENIKNVGILYGATGKTTNKISDRLQI